jgi:hypothetical protein
MAAVGYSGREFRTIHSKGVVRRVEGLQRAALIMPTKKAADIDTIGGQVWGCTRLAEGRLHRYPTTSAPSPPLSHVIRKARKGREVLISLH